MAGKTISLQGPWGLTSPLSPPLPMNKINIRKKREPFPLTKKM